MLLQFGAVHTCRVVPLPNPEVLQRMSAHRIAEQEAARNAARAIIGRHVSFEHTLHVKTMEERFGISRHACVYNIFRFLIWI